MSAFRLSRGISPRLPFSFSNGELVGLGRALIALVVGSLAVYYLTTHTSSGTSAKGVIMILFAIGAVMLFRTRREAVALCVMIGYLGLLDGFLRLKSGSSTVTMGRDLVFYPIAIGMLLRALPHRHRWQWPPLTIWVIGWTLIVLSQLFNPDSGPLLHRLASLRQDLEYVPLFFIAYAVVQSARRIRALLMLLLAIAAINGVVGLYQSTLSPAQLGAWGPGYSSMIKGSKDGAPTTTVGANGKAIVRPPALGGDMGFGGVVGMIALPGGLALLLTSRRKEEKLLLMCLIAMAAVGVVSSESRSSMISTVVGLLSFGAMMAASKEGKRVMIGIAVFGAVALLAISLVSSNSLARYNSIKPGSIGSTVVSSRAGTMSLIPLYAKEYPFGAGIGSSGPAYSQYGTGPHELNGESQITFLIGEVGIPGLILFLGFQAKVLAGAVRRIRRLKTSEHRILIAAVTAPLFAFVANWYVGVNTVSPPNAPYMWGAIGILSFWLYGKRRSGAETLV